MLPLLSAIQTILPYLLAIWLTPFVVLAVKMVRRPTADPLETFPYVKNRELFSPAERSLLCLLEQAAGEKYRVLAKVSAADIISVRLMSDQSAVFRAFDQISARNFDFVLCDKEYLSIACVIQLNDASRASQRDREPDNFLQSVSEAISLPFVHITAPNDLSVSELRKQIHIALNRDLESAAGNSEPLASLGLAANPTVLKENLGPFQIRRTL